MDTMTIQEFNAYGVLPGMTVKCVDGPENSIAFFKGVRYDVLPPRDGSIRPRLMSETMNTREDSISKFVLDNDDSNEPKLVGNHAEVVVTDDVEGTSDGGPTSYYELPAGASELNDVIEARDMSFARGNIFKAVYRLGRKSGVDAEYDLNKIIYYAERLKGMARAGHQL